MARNAAEHEGVTRRVKERANGEPSGCQTGSAVAGTIRFLITWFTPVHIVNPKGADNRSERHTLCIIRRSWERQTARRQWNKLFQSTREYNAACGVYTSPASLMDTFKVRPPPVTYRHRPPVGQGHTYPLEWLQQSEKCPKSVGGMAAINRSSLHPMRENRHLSGFPALDARLLKGSFIQDLQQLTGFHISHMWRPAIDQL